MKRKYFLVVLFLILAIFLSGCNGNGGPIPPTTLNQSPTPSFTATPTSGVAPLWVTFNASSSSDSDGTIISYAWDFRDGNTGSGETVNHTFSSIGSYNVELTVTDNEGTTDSITKTITVIPPEVENIIGEWNAISPTRLSKFEISSIGNYIYIHVWQKGNPDHPEDYDWGVQNYKISASFNGVIKLHWGYFSNWSCDQEIEVLNNGVLRVKSTETYNDQDVSYSYTDYFYNSEADNSFIPDISGVGLYQEDPTFVNLVYQLDSPEKICQYMEENIFYKLLYGPHSPYQTYLSNEADCGDYAVFASNIAHYHGYESNIVWIGWTNSYAHFITVYDMGNHYTYSSNYLYFNQSFNSISSCVNHCTSDYGYILSDYEVYDWDNYNYRNITNM